MKDSYNALRVGLVAAKALIADPSMWWKGPWIGPNGEICALRAVATATGVTDGAWADMPGCIALENALPAEFTPRIAGHYNDLLVTTHADIMALFDRAIASTFPSEAADNQMFRTLLSSMPVSERDELSLEELTMALNESWTRGGSV